MLDGIFKLTPGSLFFQLVGRHLLGGVIPCVDGSPVVGGGEHATHCWGAAARTPPSQLLTVTAKKEGLPEASFHVRPVAQQLIYLKPIKTRLKHF